MAAVGLGVVAAIAAGLEPMAGGRPVAGHLTYLGTLAALARLVSVLNARNPGAGPWAGLMGLLVLVFLIPWLEGTGLARAPGALARLRLVAPWSIFFGLLVVAGVTNYLPTRFGLAAAWLGLGFAVEGLALMSTHLGPWWRAALWPVMPWALATAVTAADLRVWVRPPTASRLEAVWLWFRDHWGVVWALRVRDRFNRSAEASGWTLRLAWGGVAEIGGPGIVPSPDESEAMLIGLLRRFAARSRIDRAEGRG
jgi:hypothetical protein